MKPVHFNCKLELWQRSREKMWSVLLSYLVVVSFHPPSLFSSFFRVFLSSVFPLTSWHKVLLIMFVLFACVYDFSLHMSQAPCENLRTPSTYPGNMLPHHPGQGNFEDFTCWAYPGEASKCALCNQSQPYNKNYPTQGVWGTDTKSNRGAFVIEMEESWQINYDKELSPKFKWRGHPKSINIS